MNTPLVSILMAAYNAEAFIAEAIESLRAQTYAAWELIIVNDGSTDRTREIAASYAHDHRIRYVAQENQGVSAARNRAFRESGGAYVTFLDTDDIYHPRKLEVQVQFLETHPEYGVAYCRFTSFYGRDRAHLFAYRRTRYEGDLLPHLLRWSLINPNTVMMRRETFENVHGFDPDFRDAEDWDLWLRLAGRGERFGFIDEVLHYNRLRRESHSRMANQVKMKTSNVKSIERTIAALSPEQRGAYGADAALRRAYLKLALAHAAIAEREGFQRALRTGLRGWYYPVSVFTRLVPMRLLAGAVAAAWRAKQKRIAGKMRAPRQ